MPKTSITYRIFVASPSDIREERNIISSVVQEINKLNPIRNIKLEVIDWLSNVYPSIGDDAQDVINTQINDDYDIFVGIIWQKFGTPTKRSESGTKEEFERAYNRFVTDPKSVHILIYFKDTPVAISEVDENEIAKIKEFKKDISDKGVLYGKFNSNSDFETIVRGHLSLLLNRISTNVEHEVAKSSSESSVIILETVEEQEDEGYYECLENSTRDMEQMTIELGKMTKQLYSLAEKTNAKTAKVYSLRSLPTGARDREFKKIVDQSSNDLIMFNKNVAPIVPLINELFKSSMNNYNKVILISKNYLKDREGLAKAFSTLLSLKSASSNNHEEFSGLKLAIENLPPFTTKFIHAKKATINILNHMIDDFRSYVDIIDNTLNSFPEDIITH